MLGRDHTHTHTKKNRVSHRNSHLVCEYTVHELHQSSPLYFWWSLCTLCLHACQATVTASHSGPCCCVCVTSFERKLTPLFVESAHALWASFSFRLWFKWRKLSVLLPKFKGELYRVLFIRLKTMHHTEEHLTLCIM